MKGRFYLVILLAMVTVFSGINILTQRYNQLSNENIPGAVELSNSDKTYKMALFGASYSFDKQNLKELLVSLKEKVPIEQARLKDFGENLLLTGKDLINQATDFVKQLTGQMKNKGDDSDKGDLV